MKKPNLFQYKISGSMFIVFILVSIIGVYTYQRYSKIVEIVNDASRPDMQLITIKGLRNDLSDAENSIKSYSLTQDPIFLSHFDETLDLVDNKLNRLYGLPESSVISVVLVDSISIIIDRKFQVLNELLSLQNKFGIEETFDKVSSEIKEIVQDTERTDKPTEASLGVEKSTRRKWRLFDRQQSDENEADSTTTTNPADALLSDVNVRLDHIKKEKINSTSQIIDQEIQLILDDRVLTEQIRAILDHIEQLELNKIANETELAKIEVEKANDQIVIFCIAIGIMLLFMTYTILNYVRNNNRYRIILAKAKKQAEDLADAKARFIANMSHEIRTPMNAIAGFTEQLAESPLNEEQTSQLNIVRKSTDHLLHLINEILDLSKLQNNKLKLESTAFYPEDIINDVREFFSLKMNQTKLTLSIVLENELDHALLGDPFRLRQILLNLISNSIKFTQEGEVKIIANTIVKTEGEVRLQILVKDTGIGMSEEQLARVFEEFEQAEISTTKKYGGTGLGLAITKQLIELQNGKLWIKSEQGIGTEITFEIPYKIDAKHSIEVVDEQPLQNTTTLEGVKILIVDDEPFNRKLLQAILEKEKAILTEAANGEEAIAEMEKADFKVVLMDMRMPIMNGIEATKLIRKSSKSNFKNTPIIALTAAVTTEDIQEYESVGMDGFVSKPFQKETVLNEIKKIIEMQNRSETQENPNNKKVDFDSLKSLSGDSPDFYADMLNTFIAGTTEGIAGIDKSLKEKDWNEMAEWAHRIASPCKHLEANTLYQYLKTIEDSCRKNENISEIPAIVEKAKSESTVVLELVRQELEKTRK